MAREQAYMELTDGELVESCRRGRSAAWKALVVRYDRLVASVLRHHGIEDHDRAQVARSVWQSLSERIDTFRVDHRFAPWLLATATRICREADRGASASRTALLASGRDLDRHLHYRAAGYEVDLRLRPGGRCGGLALTGSLSPRINRDRVQVWLQSADGVVACLLVTAAGEFRARGIGEGPNTLEIVIDGATCLEFSFSV